MATPATLDVFARNVLTRFVIRNELPTLLQPLSSVSRDGRDLDEREALSYAVFPYTVMATHASFGQDGRPLVAKLIDATAEHCGGLQGQTSDPRVITERMMEYRSAVFGGSEGPTGLEIPEDGLHYLARCACRNIVQQEVQDVSILFEVFSHFTSVLTAWEGGAGLHRLYHLMRRMGVENWLRAVDDAATDE